MLLVVCQWSRDFIDYEDSKRHWCIMTRILPQIKKFKNISKLF